MKLIETLKCINGTVQNLSFHNRRLNLARKELFGCPDELDLQLYLQPPDTFTDGVVRCRVTYEKEIAHIEYLPYQEKKIAILKVVEVPDLSYTYKWANRLRFAELLQKHPEADEVVIIQNGKITDCTIANLAFWDGQHWFTPDPPLLKGTKRTQLLETNKLREKTIRVDEIKNYQKVCLINAFRDLNRQDALDTKCILL